MTKPMITTGNNNRQGKGSSKCKPAKELCENDNLDKLISQFCKNITFLIPENLKCKIDEIAFNNNLICFFSRVEQEISDIENDEEKRSIIEKTSIRLSKLWQSILNKNESRANEMKQYLDDGKKEYKAKSYFPTRVHIPFICEENIETNKAGSKEQFPVKYCLNHFEWLGSHEKDLTGKALEKVNIVTMLTKMKWIKFPKIFLLIFEKHPENLIVHCNRENLMEIAILLHSLADEGLVAVWRSNAFFKEVEKHLHDFDSKPVSILFKNLYKNYKKSPNKYSCYVNEVSLIIQAIRKKK